MPPSHSKYYKLSLYDGMEALDATNYNTPFPYHYHPTFNVSLVYAGSFKCKLNDKFVIAPPGSILITNPGEIHANPCDKGEHTSFFTFYLSPDFINYCSGENAVYFNNKVINDAVLFAGLNNIRLSLINSNSIADSETELVKVLNQLTARYGANPYHEQSNIDNLFADMIAEESFSKFSLEDAAKRFGIDKYKFLRLFKFQTGLTPNNYFILKRIEKSKTMLTEGRELLGIAIDLGFYDTAHYCHYFKKFTGISPIAYTSGA
jgi:AraC-like DNA-binding protein